MIVKLDAQIEAIMTPFAPFPILLLGADVLPGEITCQGWRGTHEAAPGGFAST
jgi:hypothetical protein